MKSFISLLLLLLLTSCANDKAPEEKTTVTGDTTVANLSLESAYTQAINDYLLLAPQAYDLNYDTVYFGEHRYGTADDFPDIQLPATINRSVIKLVSNEAATTHQTNFPNTVFVNLMGYVEQEHAQFIFITFYKGFAHYYDHTLEYEIKDGRMVLLGHNIKQFTPPNSTKH